MTLDELYIKIRNDEISLNDFKQGVSLNWVSTASDYIYDVNRIRRNGFQEIIYGEYKSYEQIIEIAETVLENDKNVIISRFPDNAAIEKYFSGRYKIYSEERVIVVGELPERSGDVLIISGGSADHPVAAEIDLTLKALGRNSILFEDRGIAHPTRVLEAVKFGIENNIKAAIVIAGMEASLASFVASMLPLPVIGVPTSIGYGYMAKESALISMLSSCTANLCVVNIDGGIRAAVIASLIAKL